MALARFAVFGHPIAHSLSPRIHQAFSQQFGIELEFRTIDASPDTFEAAVRQFFNDGGTGANVTVPHKHAAFALAAERSISAARVGAANVLSCLPDGRLVAHNTDGVCLVRDLIERQQLDLNGCKVLMLGAGGAAWGVAWSLLDAGVRSLTIANRTTSAADKLVNALGDPQRARACRLDALADAGRFDLIVNATSAGLLGHALDLPLSLGGPEVFCYDVSYAKAALPFLAWARATGARHAVDGLSMLVETAADSFALWHGRAPVTEPVFQQLRSHLAEPSHESTTAPVQPAARYPSFSFT